MKPFISFAGKRYRLLKEVSVTEMEVFKTHVMAHTYIFKRGTTNYYMYVSHTSGGGTLTTAKK